MASRKQYDDELLIRLIARGDMTHTAIAEKVGIGRVMIGRILRGEKRPELLPKIQATVKEFRRRALRLGVRSLINMVARHIDEGLSKEADPTHARRCREFAMKLFFGMDEDEPAGPRPLPTPGLTAEDYQAICKLKGGPVCDDDDHDYDDHDVLS